jgi:hypothetical protein
MRIPDNLSFLHLLPIAAAERSLHFRASKLYHGSFLGMPSMIGGTATLGVNIMEAMAAAWSVRLAVLL